jgi:hypothetical protein
MVPFSDKNISVCFTAFVHQSRDEITSVLQGLACMHSKIVAFLTGLFVLKIRAALE